MDIKDLYSTRIKPILPLLLKSIFLTTILFAFFRLEIYSLIVSIYGDLFNMSLLGYLIGSMFGDLLAVLLLNLLVVPLLFVPWKKVAYSIYGVMIFLFIFFILAMLCQFKSFEVPFDPAILGTGMGTYMSEAINSAIYEIPTNLLIFSILLFIGSIFMIYQQYKNDRQIFKTNSNLKIGFLAIIFVALIIPALMNATAPLNQNSEKGNVPSNKEFTSNPVLKILASSEAPSNNNTTINTITKSNFKFKFNTDSLVSSIRYPKLNLARGKKYNIILYFFESTCTKYVGDKINGQSITPVWDKLKKNSFVTQNHYAHSPLSVNALFSVWASAYDHYWKVWVPLSYPWIKVKTITEILKDRGYRNAVLHSGDLNNFGHKKFLQNRKIDYMLDMADLRKLGFKKTTPSSVDDRVLIKPAIDFIKKDQSKPFFLAMFPMLPHHPYHIPEKGADFILQAKKKTKVEKRRKLLHYYNSLHFSDKVLGKFIEQLRKNRMLDNTLLFIFADHGEAFYQHRQNYLHSLRVYEENTHIPFIIYNEKMFPKRYDYKGISRHIDIAPTILDITGITPDKFMEGKSLFSSHKEQIAYLHTCWRFNHIGLRDGKWKYMKKTKTGFEELYNVEIDPDEQNNLAKKEKKILIRFRKYCEKMVAYKKIYFKKVLKRK